MTLASRIAAEDAGPRSSVLSRIFPRQFDNGYRGHWLAIALFVPVVALRAVMGFNAIAFTRTAAATADRIPLNSYGAAAADMVVALCALLGVYGLLLPVLSVAVLIRYRAMIPFMFVLLLLLQLGNRAVLMLHPTERSQAAPAGFYINLALLAATVVGFGLSLRQRPVRAPREQQP